MQVRGPVTGGTHGWAFGGPVVDLEGLGYRQDEYFVQGEATRYAPADGGELTRDGLWSAEPVDSTPYATRMVVLRPVDPGAFNGTVLVLWNNVSAGYENFGGGDSPEVFESGYAVAAVSAQRVGVHGTGDDPQGLRAWDPERYGSLDVPSDDYSFDIFSQAARSVGPGRPGHGPDPMGGLPVRRLVAMGASQSAARLATYFNAIQPDTGLFDAFMLLMYFGGGTPLEVGDAVMTVNEAVSDPSRPRIAEGTNLLRGDLGVPLMVVNTECEAASCYPVRQPDTDDYRYWEIAGSSHVTLQGMRSSAPRMERDFGFSIPLDDLVQVNQVSPSPVVDAALRHVQAWIIEGTPPPSQPRIEFGGDPPGILRDDHGIALGGIRLPDVDVPIAHNSAIQRSPDLFARLLGYHEAFPVETVKALYGSRARYLERFAESARSAEAASVVLPRDVDSLIAEAEAGCPI
jgi:Alpha/beta hydrolase domain